MGPKSRVDAAEQDLFRMELVNLIDHRHELVKLAALIDWPPYDGHTLHSRLEQVEISNSSRLTTLRCAWRRCATLKTADPTHTRRLAGSVRPR